MNKENEAKIVKVISRYKVVINKGSKQKINIGDKFLLYYLGEEDIIDNETNENLGRIEYVVGKGKITHIQENISQLETITKQTTNKKKIIKSGSSYSWNNKEEEIIESEETLIPFDNPKVGYYARQIF